MKVLDPTRLQRLSFWIGILVVVRSTTPGYATHTVPGSLRQPKTILTSFRETPWQALALSKIPRGGALPTFSAENLQHYVSPQSAALEIYQGTPEPTKVLSEPDGDASVGNEVLNLIKSIVGSGVLALPAGIAALVGGLSSTSSSSSATATAVCPVSDTHTPMLVAAIMIVTIGMASAIGFYNIAVVCCFTDAKSYQQAWIRSVGGAKNHQPSSQATATEQKTSPCGAWMPTLACLLVTTGTVLTYSMILADTVPALVSRLLPDGPRLSRTSALLGMTGLLLPVCLLRNLKSLAPFSFIGLIGTVYTAGAMAYRFSTMTNPLPSITPLVEDIDTIQTAVDTAQEVISNTCNPTPFVFRIPNAAILVSMLSTAFMAHYNAPKFYWELKPPRSLRKTLAVDGKSASRNSRFINRFAQVCLYSFGGSILLMITIALSGYGTFGAKSQGLILNNYDSSDTLMSIAKAAIALSLFFTYPLAFVGVRDQLMDLLQIKKASRARLSPIFTVVCLSVVTSLAYFLRDIRVILALGGMLRDICIKEGEKTPSADNCI